MVNRIAAAGAAAALVLVTLTARAESKEALDGESLGLASGADYAGAAALTRINQ
jgi:hypothetical protein